MIIKTLYKRQILSNKEIFKEYALIPSIFNAKFTKREGNLRCKVQPNSIDQVLKQIQRLTYP